jgi:glutathione S-transferase
MSEIILHHYPPSPVSEKVRIALGIKQLAWRSVEIPRVPPKPDVMPLTGGYRRTPVMQIGADIYCDSHCILRELERRQQRPTLYPNASEGLAWMVHRWSDSVFDAVVRVSLGANLAQLPEAFVADRARLFFGAQANMQEIAAGVPHAAAQLRAQFGWIEQALADGRSFLFGGAPGLADAACYYLIWFIRGRWQGGPALLAPFARLQAWSQRVEAIGHGQPREMSSGEAIEIARAARTTTPSRSDEADPQALQPGQRVSVTPDLDSGEPSVEGVLHRIDRDSVAILRHEARVEEVCVHFPRVGYRVAVV